MRVYVDRKYLSQQYELIPFSAEHWVHGAVIDVSKIRGPLPSVEREVIEKHVIGRSARLYLVLSILTSYVKLYFDRDSRAIVRDAGVLTDEYRAELRLVKVEVGAGRAPRGSSRWWRGLAGCEGRGGGWGRER